MTFYEILDGATDEVMRSFWSTVRIVSEQAQVTEADALAQMRRSVGDRVRAAKPTEAVDYTPDGRAALWRVRLTVWSGATEESRTLVADSDSPRPYEDHGSTLIQGLPGVAEWAWELISQAHAGRELLDLSLPAIKHKLRTLRVALSNQGGECLWRLRYMVAPDSAPVERVPGSLRGLDHRERVDAPYMAVVRVCQEAPALRKVST